MIACIPGVLTGCGLTSAADPGSPSPGAPEPAIAIEAETPAPPAAELSAKAMREGHHLAHPVCVGPVVPNDPPHRAACCYPSRELIVRPLRAAFPALRACYEARANLEAEGNVVFQFRIELDGSVTRVCASEASTMDDEASVRCMIAAIKDVRFPGMSREERDLCGLISLHYPVTFAR
ncbi:MAG: AgmX/PglI C-terminal domain-containing protein [Labilithrix sp.]|nr:AgmX/PglI C-terminal domain-containing protein [Labilithrix sp.]